MTIFPPPPVPEAEATGTVNALLHEAGVRRRRRQPLQKRLRLFNATAQATNTPMGSEGEQQSAENIETDGGIFGHWGTDEAGLPCFHYTLDQYAATSPTYLNTAKLDRRDHWHQIGNDRITALASNDGTVQVYLGDRGGVFLNRFATRNDPPMKARAEATKPSVWARLLESIITLFSNLFLKLRLAWRRWRLSTMRFFVADRTRMFSQPTVQNASSSDVHPRGVPLAESTPLAQAAVPRRPSSAYAYAGGFGYLHDGTETWSTAFRYHHPASRSQAMVRRVFGTGYMETETLYRNIRMTRRIYAPYGDHPFLLVDVTFENVGTETADLRYYEYWDVNVYQLKLQWLCGGAFAAASDEERGALNELFLPQIGWDEGSRLLRFHQHLVDTALHHDGVSDFDVAPADIFLADLTGASTAYYVDKFTFFGKDGPARPEAITANLPTIPDAPSTDSMPYCMVLRRDLVLAPGETQTQRYAYGTVRPDTENPSSMLAPFRQAYPFADNAMQWDAALPRFSTGQDPMLEREMRWHAYYLLSSTVYNEYYDTHLSPQGSAYLYIHGADGAPRDQALFALPLVYLRPDLAQDTLRLIMSMQNGQTGAIPYSFAGHGYQHDAFIHDAPSDLDLFFLLALNEYLAATGDMDFLKREVPFYPHADAGSLPRGAQGTTVLDHVRAAVAHLTHVVGTGEHDLIRIGDGDWSDGVVFDTAVKEGRVLAPLWFLNSKLNGESISNTGMALYVLPITAALLAEIDLALAMEIDQFLGGLEAALHQQWNGRWYTRAILRNALDMPVALDHDRINLEAQPWALISHAAARRGTEAALVKSISTLLDDPSPTGATLLEDGMVWPAISQLLTWGYCRNYPDLAWRSLLRHLFAVHAAVFPDVWINVWSGPDGVYAKASPHNAGGTWSSAATPMTDFPVMNNNQHAMALLGLLRVCGVEPSADGRGLIIHPVVPRERWTLDTALLRLEVTPNAIAGEYRAVATTQRTFTVRLPQGATQVEALVNSVPISVTAADEVQLRLDAVAGSAIPFEVRWS